MGFSEIVIDPSEDHRVFIDGDVAAAIVEISRLSNATDVDDGFVVAKEVEVAHELIGSDELVLFSENAWDVNVSNDAMAVWYEVETLLHEARALDVVGKNVLHDVLARTGVDGQDVVNRVGGGPLRDVLKLLRAQLVPCPFEGDASSGVHVGGAAVNDGVFVVAHEDDLGVEGVDHLEAFNGVGPVAEHISQDDDSIDASGFDVSDDSTESFDVGV